MANKSDRMSEVAQQMADKLDWRLAEFDQAIARCQEILRSSELEPEHRHIVEGQLANFRQMREELIRL